MKKTIFKSVLIFIVFFTILNILGYINHYLLGDFIIDNIPSAYNIADTFIYFPLLIMSVLYIRKKIDFNLLLNTKITINDIITIIVLCLLFRVIEDPFFRFKEIFKIKNIHDYIDTASSTNIITLNMVLLFLNTVIIAPILEELIFRGVILNSFLNKNKVIGIFISSILFALIHMSVISFVTSFLFGILLAIIFIKKGILHTILTHIVYNLIWFILKLFSQEYFQVQAILNFNLFYWSIIIIALITMILVIKFYYTKRSLNIK